MEAERREAGHQVSRARTRTTAAGWVVQVDGEQVAAGASIGALEEALRRWLSPDS